MSIINDALKKAARERAQEEGDLSTLMPGASRAQASRGGKGKSTQTIVLVAAGAVALIVVSVVLTGMLVTGKPEAAPVASSKPAPAPIQAPAAALVQLPAAALVLVPRVIAPAPTPVAAVSYQPAPAPVAIALPTPVPTAVPTATPTAIPTAIPTEPPTAAPTQAPTSAPAAAYAQAPVISLHPPTPAAPVAATPGAQAHNDLVQGLVDGIHVTGVRAAGAESKALIDGHVYRLNDVLDRSTGLRLVGVFEDHVTFVDSEGVTYQKSF
jgi:hypothetical protein